MNNSVDLDSVTMTMNNPSTCRAMVAQVIISAPEFFVSNVDNVAVRVSVSANFNGIGQSTGPGTRDLIINMSGQNSVNQSMGVTLTGSANIPVGGTLNVTSSAQLGLYNLSNLPSPNTGGTYKLEGFNMSMIGVTV